MKLFFLRYLAGGIEAFIFMWIPCGVFYDRIKFIGSTINYIGTEIAQSV
jgi:hypothetical protein